MNHKFYQPNYFSTNISKSEENSNSYNIKKEKDTNNW